MRTLGRGGEPRGEVVDERDRLPTGVTALRLSSMFDGFEVGIGLDCSIGEMFEVGVTAPRSGSRSSIGTVL